MPDLLLRLNEWKKIRAVGHYFSAISNIPYMQPNIFGPDVFKEDFKTILSLMTGDREQDKSAVSYMSSIAKEIEIRERNTTELKKLQIFLDEKDRRHGTNWREVFPWLEKELRDVV